MNDRGTTATRVRVSGKIRKSYCLWCGFETEWAWTDSHCDREAQRAAREHVESCEAMPAVQEVKRLRAQLEVDEAFHRVAVAERNAARAEVMACADVVSDVARRYAQLAEQEPQRFEWQHKREAANECAFAVRGRRKEKT